MIKKILQHSNKTPENQKAKNYMMMRIFLSLLNILTLGACNHLPTPPVSVPFEIATKGATATIDFRVTEEQQYPLYVTTYRDPKIELPPDEYYTKERKEKAVAKAIKLRLVKIEKNNEETVLLDEEFSDYKQEGHGWRGRFRESAYRITKMKLTPGIYRAIIISLDEIEIHKAAKITTEFSVTQPRSK